MSDSMAGKGMCESEKALLGSADSRDGMAPSNSNDGQGGAASIRH